MRLRQPVPILLTLGFGLAILLPSVACGDKPATSTTTAADPKVYVDTSELKPAANFELMDLSGKLVSLEGLRGQVVVLNFWATWCGPCRYEIPHFTRLYNAYKDKGVTILGVSLDAEGKSKVDPFVKAKGISYPILLDQKSAVPRLYGGVRGIPTTFVITQDGKIYRKHVGVPADMAIFEEQIKTLLGPAQAQTP
jgi:peroxiredoxin